MVDGFILSQNINLLVNLNDIKHYDLIFIFCKNEILCRNYESESDMPIFIQNSLTGQDPHLKQLISTIKRISNWNAYEFASYNDQKCLLISLSDEYYEIFSQDSDKYFVFRFLQSFFRQNADHWLMIAGLAFQVLKCDLDHQYCGRCGTKFQYSKSEFAKECNKCGNIMYPQIAPAIIIGITKGNKLLMAHNKRFPYKFFSVLAGFVNIGENLEETIKREILEEVGIKVKNITYLGSQPWPFPNSLMIGYLAEWEEGVIKCDGEEIDEARWFTPEEVKRIMLPSKISIARMIIDKFIEK